MIEDLILSGAPSEVTAWPSMMKPEEKVVLYRLAKDYFSGDGVIVDAGIFLGASTNAFASGLRENEPALSRFGAPMKKPIHAYDIAIWGRGFDRYIERAPRGLFSGVEKPKDKKSFEPLIRAVLSPHTDLIEFRIGDIVSEARADGPVEIAFYDCLKTEERDLAAFRAFAPHYIPGRTIIVQQDYFYERGHDNKIRQEMLAPYMKFLGACANSAYFLSTAPIPVTLYDQDAVKGLSVGTRRSLLERAADRAPNDRYRYLTMISIVGFLIEAGEHEEATSQIEQLESAAARHSIGTKSARYLKKLRQLAAAPFRLSKVEHHPGDNGELEKNLR